MAKKPQSSQPKAPETGKFPFKLGTVKEIPVVYRTPTVERPFPFDDMDVTTNNYLAIPLSYWTVHRKMTKEKCDPAAIKDRVRRSFYGWQKQRGHEKERANLTIALSDQYGGPAVAKDFKDEKGADDPKTYVGLAVYLTTKDRGATPKKAAA